MNRLSTNMNQIDRLSKLRMLVHEFVKNRFLVSSEFFLVLQTICYRYLI